jgi:hypothetical protein
VVLSVKGKELYDALKILVDAVDVARHYIPSEYRQDEQVKRLQRARTLAAMQIMNIDIEVEMLREKRDAA